MAEKRILNDARTLYCSFCGKNQSEVLLLIAGPVSFICDECVELCRDIVGKAREKKAAAEGKRVERVEGAEEAYRYREGPVGPTATPPVNLSDDFS